MTKTFDIGLLLTDTTWFPTRRLYIQLVAVDGDAVLAGPASRTSATTTRLSFQPSGPTLFRTALTRRACRGWIS